jgi:hypothetical protein
MYRWHTGAWQVGRKYGLIGGLSKIAWEYKLLMGEGLLFGILYLLLPIWLLLYRTLAVYAVGIDVATLTAIAAVCAIYEWRSDVILDSPAYVMLRFVDCSVFLYSFWKTLIQKKRVTGWFAVKRY